MYACLRPWLMSLVVAVLALGLLSWTASETGASEYEAYVVQQEQTLASIAVDYGITAEALAQFNHLDVKAALTAGQVILVPASAGSRATAPTVGTPGTAVTPPPAAAPPNATAPTPSGKQVEGRIGEINSPEIDIRTAPGRGRVIFAKAARGMQLLVTGESGAYYAVLMADGSTGWLPKTAVALSDTSMQVARPGTAPSSSAPSATAPSASATTEPRSPIIDTAFEYLGIPYRYGGRLPNSVDCSLFVQTVFARNGIKLPRTAAEQFEVGEHIEVTALQPCDRLYFYDRAGTIGHTAIYIGDGRFIHASSNRGAVAVDELTNETYWRKYAGARR